MIHFPYTVSLKMANGDVNDRGAKTFSVGTTFCSFEEFKTSLDLLKEEKFHPFRVFNSQTGKDYNKKRTNGKDVIDPSQFQYTYYTVRCVHYGEARSRSKGIRPNQRHFSMGCQAKITVSYDKVRRCLRVNECNLEHCHRIGETIFQHYPTNRRLNREEQNDVEEMVQLKPNNKLVRELVAQKFGKHLTLKDIQNVKTKIKERESGKRKDGQIVLDKLTEALNSDSKAGGGVVVDENDTIAILFYQSGSMREMFSRFPEIMFIDGTYNVNKLGMPLYCLMVEDGFGHGQNVFYAATVKEDASHLQKIAELFKEKNDSWESVRVIIIDKDFSEYKVLKEEFPNAVILYCQWHVIKALFKCLSDCDVEKSKREKCREIVRKLVFADSESSYLKYKEQLFESANEGLCKAFIKNWESCKSMWVTYERDQVAHFNNTTNNRLESHNQKLKDVTTRTSSLSEMFNNVLLFIESTKHETYHVAFTEEFTSRCTEDTGIAGVAELQSICTQYAADLMVKQIKLALQVDYTVQTLVDSSNVVISYKEHSHTVSPEAGTCTCTFQRTLLMPCRHIFKYRDHCGHAMFEPSLVAKRWLKSYQFHVGMAFSSSHDDCDHVSHASNEVCFASISSSVNLSSTLSQSQKYRKVHSITDRLAFYASQCGMAEFRDKYATLEMVLHFWEDNSTFSIVPTEDSTSSTKVHGNLTGPDLGATGALCDDPPNIVIDGVVDPTTDTVLLLDNDPIDDVSLTRVDGAENNANYDDDVATVDNTNSTDNACHASDRDCTCGIFAYLSFWL